MKFSILTSILAASQTLATAIVRRDSGPTCTDLTAKSNNGDRKIAIVIDSSGSMTYSDPDDLRLSAGRTINDWLISKSKAVGGKKVDLVTVIDFDSSATLDYPLGDPAGANASFANIGASGGTYIASGVKMGVAQITGSGTGGTSKRSGIVVFTDGEDSSTSTLVSQIKAASDLGIRVSFGFLDASASVQDPLVLGAVMRSGGRYATITDSASAQDFIKLVLVNGLTTNDNPSGSQDILLGGLSVSKFISGSDTVTISYNARSNESIVFSVQSVDAGTIKAQASLNGKVVDKGTSSFSSTTLTVAAPNGGKIDIAVQAQSAPKDSIVVVGAVSNLPSQNCTVGIGGGGGNKVAKSVGLGLGLPALFAVIGAGCYFFYKHFYGPKTPAGTHGTPTYVGDQVPSTVPPAEKLVEPFVQQFSSVPPMVPPPKGSPPKNQTSDNDNPDKNTDEADPDDSDYEEGDNHDTNDLPSNPNNPNNQTPNQHNKIYRPKTFKLKACECLKCVTCYDCTSDCGFECRPNQDNFNCGEKCKINCTHEGDCFEDKAHDTHRHRCHRCEKHNKKARREEAIKKSVASIAVAAVKTAVHAAI